MAPPFRADHVGSLLRPKELLAARADYQKGLVSTEDLRRQEDAAIAEAVRMQEDIGLPAITDGEFRRASWHMDFLYQIGGVTKEQDNLQVQFHNEKGDIAFTPTKPHIAGKLHLGKTIFADAFAYLKSVVKTGTPKLTIPSPSMLH
ncbi:MAG: 5-methyltetrahydropteroyltriglutamate--homocysteine S-methyltransferase, partial [Alphaproteobacteria bacterium]|nr:5-methyltetrahydropteroyltriglutamate--homocysteine S-methyltransferase [Alphaproteobacteria bacterium]